MNQEERFWINQSIFYHKDIQYNTNNSLELSFTSSTQDFQTYSSPSLNLSITNANVRKVFVINYQTAVDLTRAFKQGSQNNFENFSLYRKSGDRALKVEVHQLTDSKEWVTTLTVVYSSSDTTIIVLPMGIFFSIMCLIRDFSTYYLNLAFDFTSRSLMTELLKETKELKSSIKALPSFLKELPSTEFPPFNIPKKESDIANQKGPERIDTTLTNDLSEFMDKNIDSIEIPEIIKAEEKAELVEQVRESPFINGVLKNDISVFENLFNSASVKMSNSVLTFKDILEKGMKIENVDYLPGISKNELKSVLFMTKILFGQTLFSFVNSSAKVPKAIPVIKYQVDPKVVQSVNMDLAYDLLLISGYLRLMKNQLEDKVIDQVASKSFLYLTLRCFTDIFTFSFLEDKDEATIKSCVLSRFRQYHKSGFFKKYEFILQNYNCKEITENDLSVFLDEVCTKIVRKSPFIKQVHEKNYEEGFLSIPFENDFSVEQIINEAAFLEIAKRVNIDINNEADLSRLVDPFAISDEVKEMFNKKQKPVVKKKEKEEEKEKDTNIVRFVTHYRNEVPERFRDKFISYLKELRYGPCVLDNQDFPLEELGESIVKGLYVWNDTDDKEKDKYTDFYLRFETCLLDKKLIIAKSRGAKKETPSGNWLSASEIEV